MTTPATTTRRSTTLWLLGIVLLSGVIRVVLAASAVFPVGESGLVYRTVEAVRADGYALPLTVTYNDLDVPAIHPPIAFYLTAALTDLSGLSLLTVFRWLPVALSIIAIVAFHDLARQALADKRCALWATLLFSLLPTTYAGLLGGPGIIEAAGMLLGVITMAQVYRLIQGGTVAGWLACILLMTLTALTAPGWAVFVSFSAVALLFTLRPDPIRNIQVFLVIAAAVVAGGAWVYFVQRAHGMQPFNTVLLSELNFQAVQQRVGLFFGGPLSFTAEPIAPVIGALVIVGFFVSFGLRRPGLGIWTLAILFLPSMNAAMAAVPSALLAALAADYLLLTGLSSFRKPRRYAPDGQQLLERGSDWAVYTSYLALGAVVVLGTLNIAYSRTTPNLRAPSISPADLDATAWMQENLSQRPNIQILILTGQADWSNDSLTEWFPVLAGMPTTTGVRATRLAPDVSFDERVSQYQSVQDCLNRTLDCLQPYIAPDAAEVYLYIAPGARGALWAPLLTEGTANPYTPVYPTATRDDLTPGQAVIFQQISS